MTADERCAAERWLVRQGLPQALPASVRRRRLLARVAPLGVLLAMTFIFWSLLNRLAASVLATLGEEGSHSLEDLEQLQMTVPLIALSLSLPVVLVTAVVTAWALRRWAGDQLAAAIAVIALLAMLVVPLGLDRHELRPTQLAQGALLRGTLAALAVWVVYAGGGAVSRWAIRRAVRELDALGPMVSRALPLLVLSMLFFFFNAEIWQVAGGIGWTKTWGTVGVLAVSSMLLVVVNLTDEVKDLFQRHAAADRFEQVLADTPMVGWDVPPARPPLGRGERLNLILVPATAQIFQIALFTAVVFVFFLGFGELTVPDSVAGQWMGRPPDPGSFLGFRTGISQQHLQVSLMLSGLAALSFAASSSAESAYRTVFVDPVLRELEQDLYARDAYVHRFRVAEAARGATGSRRRRAPR